MRRATTTFLPARLALASSPMFTAALRMASTPAAPTPGKFTDPDMTHFRNTPTKHPLYEKPTAAAGVAAGEWANPTANHVWSEAELANVTITHRPTVDVVDSIAYFGVKVLRVAFDVVSGYMFGRHTPPKMLRRILFLETAAGIPGMVAGSVRHLQSLRLMRRDHGWIHTLLEEAENERMHMLVFMRRHKPGLLFRSLVVVTQGVFWNVFFFTYLVCPRLCHRFVGYLEEEAVRTYTHILDLVDSTDPKYADVAAFGKSKADDIAIAYWKLSPDATMRDVLLAVRADESNHRDVNHTFAGLQPNEVSPFVKRAQQAEAAAAKEKSSAAAAVKPDAKKP